MYQNDTQKVLTGEVRLSYCALTTPRAAAPGAEPKYSVTLLIPKTDVATKADIDAAIQSAVQEGMQTKWKGVQPPSLKIPIHDGDGVRQSGELYGEECRGHWVLNASSKQKPGVVHISNIKADLAPTDIYSGMYARVTVRFFAYASNGNKGIGCGLGNILKIREGEPLGGHASASSDFAGLEQVGGVPQGYPTTVGIPAYPTQVMPQGYPVVDPITGMPVYGG